MQKNPIEKAIYFLKNQEPLVDKSGGEDNNDNEEKKAIDELLEFFNEPNISANDKKSIAEMVNSFAFASNIFSINQSFDETFTLEDIAKVAKKCVVKAPEEAPKEKHTLKFSTGKKEKLGSETTYYVKEAEYEKFEKLWNDLDTLQNGTKNEKNALAQETKVTGWFTEKKNATPEEKIQKAIENKIKEIDRYKNKPKDYGNGKDFRTLTVITVSTVQEKALRNAGIPNPIDDLSKKEIQAFKKAIKNNTVEEWIKAYQKNHPAKEQPPKRIPPTVQNDAKNAVKGTGEKAHHQAESGRSSTRKASMESKLPAERGT